MARDPLDYYDPELSDEDNAELNKIMETLDQDEKRPFADICDELIKLFPHQAE